MNAGGFLTYTENLLHRWTSKQLGVGGFGVAKKQNAGSTIVYADFCKGLWFAKNEFGRFDYAARSWSPYSWCRPARIEVSKIWQFLGIV
jgi:hypothetical protein